MAITAIIPVRQGSTRIKDKNIRKFGNTSLLENKIQQLKKTKGIDEIIVSSDSDVMLQIACENGVIAKKRPPEYCDEKTKTFNEVVRYIADYEVTSETMMWTPCVCPFVTNKKFEEGISIYRNCDEKTKTFNEVVRYIADYEVTSETMMWAPCVCPFVTNKKFEEGISIYRKIQEERLANDSVATAALIKEYIFDQNGPLNFSVENHVTSQNLPDWHYITNGFFIAETINMSKWGFVYGKTPYLCEVNKFEAVDIDDNYDFVMAETILEYLKGCDDYENS
jgi:CMP-N-acetylneuraminic acid synthetase